MKKAKPQNEYRAAETRWLSEHREWLEENHPGEWVAVEGNKLVAVGGDLKRVMEESKAKGVAQPLLDCVRKKEFQGVFLIRLPRILRERD